jgi:hypothetical protein
MPVAQRQDKSEGFVDAGKLTRSQFGVTVSYCNLCRFGKAGDADDLFSHIFPFFKRDCGLAKLRYNG